VERSGSNKNNQNSTNVLWGLDAFSFTPKTMYQENFNNPMNRTAMYNSLERLDIVNDNLFGINDFANY
jgi:hypothetical protein